MAMPRLTISVLVVSLIANAALAGVIGGRLLNHASSAPTPNMQYERYGPASDVVQAAWAKLPNEDRQALRAQLKQAWDAAAPDRQRLQESGREVAAAALVEPFDEARLRNALYVFQRREAMLQQRAQDILIGHLGKMPPEARSTAAVGLLTPFSARVQRRQEQQTKDAAGKAADAQGPANARPSAPASAGPPKTPSAP